MYFKPMNTEAEWEWFVKRTFCIRCEDSCGIVAYSSTGQIKAVVGVDSLTQVACNIHLAVESPMVFKYGLLQEASHLVFDVLKRERMFGLVPSTNLKALKLNRHLGFTQVAEIPDAVADGVGYCILSLEKEDCSWYTKTEEAA